MGWPKYMEDNEELIEERMAMKNYKAAAGFSSLNSVPRRSGMYIQKNTPGSSKSNNRG